MAIMDIQTFEVDFGGIPVVVDRQVDGLHLVVDGGETVLGWSPFETLASRVLDVLLDTVQPERDDLSVFASVVARITDPN